MLNYGAYMCHHEGDVTMTTKNLGLTSVLIMIAMPALADSHSTTPRGAEYFEGLYRPAGAYGATWSCDPQFLGQDGGALGVVDGYLEGLENRCELTNPTPTAGDRTAFEAVCSAEGSTYTRTEVLGRTADGIVLGPVGDDVSWVSCDAGASALDDEGRWQFDGTVASILHEGMAFTVSCEMFNPSAMYPAATLSGYCPMCFQGEPEDFVLNVDGEYRQTYEFEKISNAAGWASGLDFYPVWFEGLIPALMSGRELVITSSDGSAIAAFPLAGSSNALTALVDRCR